MPLVRRHVDELLRLHAHRYARVVHEDVDRAELVCDGGDGSADRGLVGDVEDGRHRLTAGAVDRRDRCCGAVGLAVIHGDARTLPRERRRDPRTHVLARTRDERDTAGDVEHVGG
jgi:hypothetical protein